MNRMVTSVELTCLKGENGDLLADFLNILHRYKNYLHQLLNAHVVNNIAFSMIALLVYSKAVWSNFSVPSGQEYFCWTQ
jgi:hypothetical protein